MKPEETAHKWANTRKGAWRVAHSQILSTKLTNGILKKNGWCWLGMLEDGVAFTQMRA